MASLLPADDRGRLATDAAAYDDFDGWHARASALRAEGERIEAAGPAPYAASTIVCGPERMPVRYALTR